LNDDGSSVGSQPKQIEIKGSRHVTAIAFRKNKPGSYLCTTHTGLAYLDELTGQVEHLPNGLGEIISESDQDRFRFNDGVCDSKGRWYFHSMSRDESQKTAKLYMYEQGMNDKSELKVLEEGFAIGNGPVIDEERRKFYFNFTEQGIGCRSS
jgi:sugar lactone lactonase YvrE